MPLTFRQRAYTFFNVANVVVVSTHLDDAVFSCWHVIDDHHNEVSVVTVFTSAPPGKRGSWDSCIDPVDSEFRARERQTEDRRALGLATRVPIHLGFYDSQFGVTEKRSRVVKALEPHVGHADVVFAPLAIRNADHLLVREAVREIRRRPCFYADYPYALRHASDPRHPSPGLLEAYEQRDVLLDDEEVERKLTACREYSGELERLRRCASYGDFANADNLRRETVYHPHPQHG